MYVVRNEKSYIVVTRQTTHGFIDELYKSKTLFASRSIHSLFLRFSSLSKDP